MNSGSLSTKPTPRNQHNYPPEEAAVSMSDKHLINVCRRGRMVAGGRKPCREGGNA